MNRIFVHGLGAVSPAGWGASALQAALKKGDPIPTQTLTWPGWEKPLEIRSVPPPVSLPAFFAHPRLRRASAISQYTVAAALEALGDDTAKIQSGALRLGVVVCVMSGSVVYSRRFYEEVLKDPSVASPLVFPETVFNAPASHLAAYLGTPAINYTLVGDDGIFLQGLALAANWLITGKVDACVVIGAEETDWVVSDAVRLFHRAVIHSGGAGALYLKKKSTPAAAIELTAITDSFSFTQKQNRVEAVKKMRTQLPHGGPSELLCVSAQKVLRADAAENSAWHGWTGVQLAPKSILGEAFVAAAAWQCVTACDAIALGEFSAANVSVVGVNQQAIGARFLACAETV
ncbi:MAG: beta-ketoacyl synthase N-terminal-like domain-containing protein [Verrucomicrobiota bacterium]